MGRGGWGGDSPWPSRPWALRRRATCGQNGPALRLGRTEPLQQLAPRPDDAGGWGGGPFPLQAGLEAPVWALPARLGFSCRRYLVPRPGRGRRDTARHGAQHSTRHGTRHTRHGAGVGGVGDRVREVEALLGRGGAFLGRGRRPPRDPRSNGSGAAAKGHRNRSNPAVCDEGPQSPPAADRRLTVHEDSPWPSRPWALRRRATCGQDGPALRLGRTKPLQQLAPMMRLMSARPGAAQCVRQEPHSSLTMVVFMPEQVWRARAPNGSARTGGLAGARD